MKFQITARAPECLDDDGARLPEGRPRLRAGDVADLPDTTAEFLAAVAPYGRFSVDLSTTPPTLYFQNDYD